MDADAKLQSAKVSNVVLPQRDQKERKEKSSKRPLGSIPSILQPSKLGLQNCHSLKGLKNS